MKTLFRLSLACLAVVAVPVVQAADLLQLYEQARAQDATFLAAEQARSAGQEARIQGSAPLYPQLSFSGDLAYNWSRQDEASLFRSNELQHYRTGRATLQATQVIWNPAQRLQARQGDLQADLANLQFEVEQQNLALRVAQAYFDVLDANDAVELAAAQKAATSQQLAQAKKAFEVGTATITDTHEAQARADQIAAQEIAALNNLAVKREALRQLTGVTIGNVPSLSGGANLGAIAPGELSVWLNRASTHNLVLQSRLIGEQAASLSVRQADAAHWPTLDAVGTASRNNDPESMSGGHSSAASIALQLKVPLYSGGALSSRSREALVRLRQSSLLTEAARREAELQVRTAHSNTTSGLASIKALEQALVSTKSTLESTTLGRQVGVRTNLDVLNAQQQFYSARRDLSQARYRYLLNRLQLEAAAGDLDVADLQAINALLAP